MTNINYLMKQAQQLQAKIAELQAKNAGMTFDGSAGGGLVKATTNGKGKLTKLQIDPSLINPQEIEVLEDLIIAAVNDASSKSESQLAQEMNSLTGGIGLPAGMKVPF